MKQKNIIIITLAIDLGILLLMALSYYSIVLKSNIMGIKETANVITINSPPLRKDDIVTALNGIPLNSREHTEYLCDNLAIGSLVSITVNRDGSLITTQSVLTSYYDNFYNIVLLIAALSFFIPAVVVLFKSQQTPVKYVYHWLSMSTGLMIMLTYGRIDFFPEYFRILLRVLFDLAYITTPFIFIHFTFVFPRIKFKNYHYIVYALYALSALLAIISAYYLYNIIIVDSTLWIEKYLSFRNSFIRSLFVPAIIFIVFTLLHSYLVSKDHSERSKLLWVYIGMVFGPLIYVLLYLIPNLITSHPLINEAFMLLAVTVSPVTLFIAIVRYRFWDVELFINRATVYGSVIAGLASVYIAIMYILSKFLQQFFSDFNFYAGDLPIIFSALTVALLFQPMKSKIQTYVDKHFFRVRYNYRITQRHFAERMKFCYNQSQVSSIVAKTLTDILPLEKYAFLHYDKRIDYLEVLININFQFPLDFTDSVKKMILTNIFSLPLALPNHIEDGIEYIAEEDGTFLEPISAELTVIYVSEDRSDIYLLILGRKKSHFKFSHEDVDILKMIVFQAGLSVQRIKLQNELLIKQAAVDKLQELNNLKTYFVSSVSHDLKTPLTSIRMFAEIMQLNPDISRDKEVEFLSIIQSECDRLSRLINNVLDYAKIERGTKEFFFEKAELGSIVKNVIKTLEYQMKLKKFIITADLDIIDYPVLCDKDAIAEALINLISNSMKYSLDKKKIIIKTFCDERFYCVSIADKGIGISEEDLEKVFEAFYRSKDPNTAHSGGAGIGLSVVKSIIDAHNGDIKVESSLGEGSCFTIYLPREAQNEKTINS